MHGVLPAEGAGTALLAGPDVLLPWLVRLRWVAVAGQAVTLAVATAILGASLPLLPLGAVVGVTAATNAWLAWRSPAPSPRAVPALLTLDTLLLTALLGLSGGPGNPFTALYVVHVALAAVALPAVWTWWTVALSGACYAGLFWLHVPLQFGTGGPSVALQTAGWGVAVLLVAAVTATFIAPVSSALRARESQLSAAEARAARSEWLASLAALAAGTAHELGTPLGTIAVAARELERVAETVGGASEDRVVDDARLIRTQVDRCRAILDRLSALDPGGGGRPAPIALSQLLAGVHEEGDPGEGGPVVVRVADGLDLSERVHAEAALALAPLVQNALDATDGAGPVTVALDRSGDRVKVSVRDLGPGMTLEVREAALEPFFTTKEGRGMGLGLYVARLVSERRRGRLDLESEPGRGTTATLTLPLEGREPAGAGAT